MKKKIGLLLTCAFAAAAVTGCSGSAASSNSQTAAGDNSSDGAVKMTMSWWGNQVRNERTQQALELYGEQNPGVTIEGQFSEWSNYWDKLATSAAGQAIPDLVQMDYMYLDQYVKNGMLLDLTPYIEDGTLNVSDISENTMASGSVDGGIYAICAGINSPSLLYNKNLLDENSIEIKDNMTIDEFYAVCLEVFEKTGVKTILLMEFLKPTVIILSEALIPPSLWTVKWAAAPKPMFHTLNSIPKAWKKAG